jgi:hypothetical protein
MTCALSPDRFSVYSADKQTEYSLLWGDIHRQTALTCGEGAYLDHLRAAEQAYKLDFLAVTDNACLAEDPRLRQFAGDNLRAHRHFFNALQAHSISTADWNQLRRFVQDTKTGKIIFFLGYEWCSNRYGDHNVYYLNDGPLALPTELTDLHAAVSDSDALIIMHHPGYCRGRRGVDWNHHEPRLERLVEIFSTQHGSSEGLEPDPDLPLYSRSMGGLCATSSVQEALLRRYKLGFVAGSDAHSLSQTPGITGVYVPERSREALWDGLHQRRTIATTGPKFPLWVTADSHPMGSIVTTDKLPEFTIDLPTFGWERAELIRNGKPIKVWHQAHTGVTEVPETASMFKLRYSETPSAELWPDNYYYVRVYLAEGQRAWSSPIWVSYLPDTSFVQDTLYWLPEERCLFWVECEGDGARCTVENRYVAGAAVGGLKAPQDVTLRDVQLTVMSTDGRVITAHQLEDVTAGGSLALHVDRPSEPHYFRIRFRDCFNNVRYIERHACVPTGQEGIFRIATAKKERGS